MAIITENKKLLCATSICNFADIIISHDTNSTQTECAVSGLKTILKNIMPYLRDEKDAESLVESTFKGLAHLKENAEFSLARSYINKTGEYLNLQNDLLFVTVFPSVCGAFVSKMTENNELFERFLTLSKALGTGEILSDIPKQWNFINEVLDFDAPDFIGEEYCKTLTIELTQISDLDYDTLEDFVYSIFRKTRASKIKDPDFIAGDKAFVDDPHYLAKRERSVFVKGLQKYTLEALVLTKQFLDEHGLRFYLTEGTMLGAIRHKGFIPWDDDIDIAMPREDYDKLVELAFQGKIPPELNFDALENNPNHWVLGAKMQLVRQTPYIQHKVTKLSKCNGPYVDIFPLDYWNKPTSYNNAFANICVKMCRRLIFIKTGYSKATKKKFARIIARIFLPIMSNRRIQKFAIKNMKKFYSGNRKYLVNLCSYYPYYKEVFPTSFFGEPVYVDFEGHKMPVPCEYDYMLKTVYGKSYDTIPPARVTDMRKHAFDLREDIK